VLCALVNLDLVKLFYRRKGALFALGGFLFHQFYYVYSSAAYVWALVTHPFIGRRDN
jgi:hypothetical protein